MEDSVASKTWNVLATVERWDRSEDFDAGREPDSVDEYPDNLLLNAGITRLCNLLIGAGGTAYNAANSRIGVGNSTTAASAAQTDLQGASKFFKIMDATFPSVASQTITWKSTFASGDANFTWEEWGVDNGTADSSTVTTPMLNRKVAAMGTKGSGSTWALTVSITIS